MVSLQKVRWWDKLRQLLGPHWKIPLTCLKSYSPIKIARSHTFGLLALAITLVPPWAYQVSWSTMNGSMCVPENPQALEHNTCKSNQKGFCWLIIIFPCFPHGFMAIYWILIPHFYQPHPCHKHLDDLKQKSTSTSAWSEFQAINFGRPTATWVAIYIDLLFCFRRPNVLHTTMSSACCRQDG